MRKLNLIKIGLLLAGLLLLLINSPFVSLIVDGKAQGVSGFAGTFASTLESMVGLAVVGLVLVLELLSLYAPAPGRN